MIKKILYRSDGKKYYIRDISKDYHCEHGIIEKKDLKKSGEVISKTGKKLFLMDAGFSDNFKKIKKKAQTIPIKDLGFILAYTGIGKDDIVVEGGTGSAASAIFFSRYVKKVYSYDKNEEHLKVALKNIEDQGIKNIIVKNHDMVVSIPQKSASLVLLDVPEPWILVNNAFKSLKIGGYLVSYSPTILQSNEFVKTAEKQEGLIVETTVEVTIRPWKITGRIVRPHIYEIPHSAFITFVRKVG